MDALRDSPPMIGSEPQSTEDQEIKRALRKIDALLLHSFPLYFYRELYITALVEVQGRNLWLDVKRATRASNGRMSSKNLFPNFGTLLDDPIDSSDSNSHLCGDPLPADPLATRKPSRSS